MKGLDNATSRGRDALVASLALLSATAVWAAPQKTCELTVGGYAGTTTLADFPVAVRVSEARIAGFDYDDCGVGVTNVWFASDLLGQCPIPHEVERWDTAGESIVWVRIPKLAGKQTKFFMFWKDDNPPANDPTAVWGEFAGVWHLGEADASTNSNAVDSTGHGFDASIPSNVTTGVRCEAKAAKIGFGRWKPKTTMTIPNYDSQNVGGTFTASGWFYLDERTTYESFFGRKTAWNEGKGWQVNMQNNDVQGFCTGSGTTCANPNFTSNVKKRWIHLALVYSGTNLKMYDNTTKMYDGKIVAADDNGRLLYVGGSIKGIMDEIRIRKAASTVDWVKAEYDAANNTDFVTSGAAEEYGTNFVVIGGDAKLANEDGMGYGLKRGLVDGQEYALTAPALGTNVAGTVVYTCAGWTMALTNGTVITNTSTSVRTNTFTYGPEYSMATQTWKWAVHSVGAIRSTGTQYVNTGVKADANTRMVVKFRWTDTSNGGGMGYAAGSSGPSFRFFRQLETSCRGSSPMARSA